MKFKTIYILFNAVILLSFGFIFLMPLLLLGSDYFALFVPERRGDVLETKSGSVLGNPHS